MYIHNPLHGKQDGPVPYEAPSPSLPRFRLHVEEA